MIEATLKQLESARRIAFAGDWHGDAVWAKESLMYANKNDADVMIQLGDFGIWPGAFGKKYRRDVSEHAQKHRIPVFFIDGNHEDFDWLLRQNLDADGLRPVEPGVTHIPRGFRWECQGLIFGALGGGTSLDKPRRQEGVSWWSQEAITIQQANTFADEGNLHVMLTHDCPEGTNIPGITHREYVPFWPKKDLDIAWDHREMLRRVVEEVEPLYLFHGHFHVRYQDAVTFNPASDVITLVAGLADNTSHSLKDSVVIWDVPR